MYGTSETEILLSVSSAFSAARILSYGPISSSARIPRKGGLYGRFIWRHDDSAGEQCNKHRFTTPSLYDTTCQKLLRLTVQ
jgi:hypothetical protein